MCISIWLRCVICDSFQKKMTQCPWYTFLFTGRYKLCCQYLVIAFSHKKKLLGFMLLLFGLKHFFLKLWNLSAHTTCQNWRWWKYKHVACTCNTLEICYKDGNMNGCFRFLICEAVLLSVKLLFIYQITVKHILILSWFYQLVDFSSYLTSTKIWTYQNSRIW